MTIMIDCIRSCQLQKMEIKLGANVGFCGKNRDIAIYGYTFAIYGHKIAHLWSLGVEN